MNLSDMVTICFGWITLGATFVLGVLVGVSLRKDLHHGRGNEGTYADSVRKWHNASQN